jgi:formylglycine-generating enzyme required for sulfatase activity
VQQRPGAMPETPVGCVDFCDAVAYCAWSQKRLCGARGGQPLDKKQTGLIADDEWYLACTDAAPGRAYPYGENFDQEACATNRQAPVEVGSLDSCRTDSGIFDMSGNLAEWSSACSDSEESFCLTRGGSYAETDPAGLSCVPPDPAVFAVAPDVERPTIGIRCCKD